jgi:hypothetical protein
MSSPHNEKPLPAFADRDFFTIRFEEPPLRIAASKKPFLPLLFFRPRSCRQFGDLAACRHMFLRRMFIEARQGILAAEAATPNRECNIPRHG